ncbi:MAG: addiction module protein, partial [Cyanobacteria bacterium J06648_10]
SQRYILASSFRGFCTLKTYNPLPTEEQKQELDRRVEAYEQAPDDVMTWQGIVGFQRTKTSK